MRTLVRTTALAALALAMLGTCFVSRGYAQCVAILSSNTATTQPRFADDRFLAAQSLRAGLSARRHTQDDAAGNQLAQVKGNITATRLTVDRTINQLL